MTSEQQAGGYWPFASLVWNDPEDLQKGAVAYITVGVDGNEGGKLKEQLEGRFVVQQ